ncbi:hypothetical protein BT69DRAFT_1324989 [Atractiella rhizophila]|nr:hypothetical protein BT69DRAFT_1324989 [Atractiella rhizophila]
MSQHSKSNLSSDPGSNRTSSYYAGPGSNRSSSHYGSNPSSNRNSVQQFQFNVNSNRSSSQSGISTPGMSIASSQRQEFSRASSHARASATGTSGTTLDTYHSSVGSAGRGRPPQTASQLGHDRYPPIPIVKGGGAQAGGQGQPRNDDGQHGGGGCGCCAIM